MIIARLVMGAMIFLDGFHKEGSLWYLIVIGTMLQDEKWSLHVTTWLMVIDDIQNG